MFRSALLVTEDLAEMARWREWLEAAGFSTVACAGPRLRPYCPLEDGGPCLLREAVDVAIVAVDPRLGFGPLASRTEPVCVTVPDDGTTIFVDDHGLRGEVRGRMRPLGPVSEQSLVERAQYVCSRKGHPAGRGRVVPGLLGRQGRTAAG
jgi:hypothetical protein